MSASLPPSVRPSEPASEPAPEREPRAGSPRLGLDLGGTKTEVAVLGADGRFLLRRRAPTPRDDYAATVALLRDLVVAAEHEVGRALPVGVGIPGAISPATGLVKNANSTWLNGRPLQHDLEAALGRAVRMQNDANCLAVSEAVDGAAAGAHCVFAVILGTGVGAGICIDGRPLTGRQAIAGEWGHNPLPPPALPPALPHVPTPAAPTRADDPPPPVCWCGRMSCVEAWLSGPALAREHRAVTGESVAIAADAAAILARARAGDPAAMASRDRHADRLARALGGVVNLLDPDVIVLGGGLSNEAWLYEALPARIAPHVFSDRFDTPIRPALHGDSSGVRGAAWLWPPSAVVA